MLYIPGSIIAFIRRCEVTEEFHEALRRAQQRHEDTIALIKADHDEEMRRLMY